MWFKSTPLLITYAKAEDAQSLAKLHGDNFARGWTKAEFETIIYNKNAITLVAKKPTLEGFIAMSIAVDEAEILSIAVDKTSRKQGIALKLLKEIWPKLALKGVKHVFLEVSEENIPARALYTKLNFKEVGRRKSYYGSGLDALVLKRTLV